MVKSIHGLKFRLTHFLMKKRMYSTDQSFKKLAKLNLHLIILVLSFIGNAQTQSAHLKEIILLIGQSNMAGRANLMDRDLKSFKTPFFSQHQCWKKSPLNIHSSIRKVAGMQRYNLGYSFAREVLNNKYPQYLVVNARGGTKIDQWVPGTHYFNEAIRRSKSAIGSKGKIIATLASGESNLSDKDPGYKSYSKNLNQSYTA